MQVVVDTNIFVSAFDPRDPFHSECYRFLEKLRCFEFQAICPLVVLIETVCVSRRRTGDALVAQEIFQELALAASIHWLETTFQSAEKACRLGVKTGLKGGDAMILQVAEDLNLPLLNRDRGNHEKGAATVQLFEPGDLPG